MTDYTKTVFSDRMKPWGYIHPEIEKILRDKTASNTCITKKRAGYNTMPLYTAEQLAEAVAVERERCAKVCEENIRNAYRSEDWDAACEELSATIRSAKP